ncbi:hypothetical protein EBR96_08740, partial [bacterium]|nr:hypothetical protein [bacterium]
MRFGSPIITHKIPTKPWNGVVVVGEFPNREEDRTGQYLSGYRGVLLRELLQTAKIDPDACYFTYVFNVCPPFEDGGAFFENKSTSTGVPFESKVMPPQHEGHLTRLKVFLSSLPAAPKIIITLGKIALWALTGYTKISQYRGTFLQTVHGNVLPTYSAEYIMKVWDDYPIVVADLLKATSKPPVFENREIWIAPLYTDLLDFERLYIDKCESIAFDIETWLLRKVVNQICSISISPSPHLSLVVPFVDFTKPDWSYWPRDVEVQVWKWLKRILSSQKTKIAQNGIYDIVWLARYGVFVRGQY